MMMKILVISRTPWRSDNSFGNSFTNIFGGIRDIELANIYCLSGFPDSNICSRYFQITESMMLRSLIDSDETPGKEVFHEITAPLDMVDVEGRSANKFMNIAKRHRWQILFWVRELIWKIGRWKSPNLDQFVDEFNPDLIILPLYYQHYMNDIGLYVVNRAGKKMVAYVSDDVYTWSQFSYSPLYWIDRFFKRRTIKSAIDHADLLYVISERQREEYQEIFRLPCKVLYKCGEFQGEAPVKETTEIPIRLVYTGNLGGGRWTTLVKIGDSIKEINRNGVRLILDIYSLTPVTKAMRNRLDDGVNVFFNGALAAADVDSVQESADVLVHAESFERKDFLAARLSFSTKIVDYLHHARCIFAVGAGECASIEYLEVNDAGLVATSEQQIGEKLKMIVESPAIIREFGNRAYACGKRNHRSDKVKTMLKTDLRSVLDGRQIDPKNSLNKSTYSEGSSS